MSAIGPGDWVECIRVGRSPTPAGFRVGAVYRVERTVKNGGCAYHGRGAKCGGLFICEMPRPGAGGWAACAFRPIYRPKADLIKGLLKPIDAPAEPERVNA